MSKIAAADDSGGSRIKEKLVRELGPLVMKALSDDLVTEVMLNPDGTLWLERLDTGMTPIGKMSAITAEALLGTVASTLDTVITRERPTLEGELILDGSRFAGMLPPVVSGPAFVIRKRAKRVFTLSDYVAHGIMTEFDSTILSRAVKDRENILVVGGTRSGKTTLTNALIDEMVAATPDHRIVIIEDTAEIQCSAENALLLHTTENVGMRELLRLTLRSRPDRILVGEVRGGEALSLLKAWNTGHPGGVATIHANNAVAGLVRLEQLVGEVSASPSSVLIGEAVDVVVAIEMGREGRVVREIIEVTGYRNGQYETRVLSRREENAEEVGQAVDGLGDGGSRFVRIAGR